MKLNPLKENLEGKRIVVVDDSIVRGTTQRTLTQMLREAGATEVHLRITSPPVMWSCFYGIDTGVRSELLAANIDLTEIRDFLRVDSIAYLDLDRLIAATGTPQSGFCDACFTGATRSTSRSAWARACSRPVRPARPRPPGPAASPPRSPSGAPPRPSGSWGSTAEHG